MASFRRSGSRAPTSSAPFSAPFNDSGSGPLTHRMIPAPFRTSARLPILAPADSNSASRIEAASPAAFSTATSAPSVVNFFTVSGIAAHRVSPADSLSTAIFIAAMWLADDQQDGQPDDEANDGTPLHHAGELVIVMHVPRDFLSGRIRQQRLLVRRHKNPFSYFDLEPSITTPRALPKS